MLYLPLTTFLAKEVAAEYIIAHFAELCNQAIFQQKHLWRNKAFADTSTKNRSRSSASEQV